MDLNFDETNHVKPPNLRAKKHTPQLCVSDSPSVGMAWCPWARATAADKVTGIAARQEAGRAVPLVAGADTGRLGERYRRAVPIMVEGQVEYHRG